MAEWQRIGEIPVDTGRLVLVDPMNVDDVARHEDDTLARLEEEKEEASLMTYELVTNEHGNAVAVVLQTGLGDGSIRSRHASRRRPAPSGSPRSVSGSSPIR